MRPIVLATDGSPSAAEATLDSIELAKELGARLVAVSVEHVTVPGYAYYGYAEVLGELTQIEKDHVEKTLAEVSAVAAEAGVACDVVSRSGSVADMICKVAKQHNARMIVIGAHGWNPIGRVLHGSVSTAVMHQAPCPVLVVRGGPDVLLDQAPAQQEVVH